MHFYIVSKCQNYNLFISLYVCVCQETPAQALPFAQAALPALCLWEHIVPELTGTNKDAVFLSVVSVVGWGAWCTPRKQWGGVLQGSMDSGWLC